MGVKSLSHFPPPLTPPTEGGGLKGCHSSPCAARGILVCFHKIDILKGGNGGRAIQDWIWI